MEIFEIIANEIGLTIYRRLSQQCSKQRRGRAAKQKMYANKLKCITNLVLTLTSLCYTWFFMNKAFHDLENEMSYNYLQLSCSFPANLKQIEFSLAAVKSLFLIVSADATFK